MKSQIKIAACLILLILVSGFGACTPKSTQTQSTAIAPETLSMVSAVLSEITGKVEIKQAGQVGFAPAHVDAFLNENGQVQTGDDGRVRLNLSTGTIVRVAPASLFTLVSNKQSDEGLKTHLELTLGKLFIILNGGSMDVDTPTGTAAVRGSYMSVSYNSTTGEVRVTCLEGHCSLASTGGSVDITAGQTAVITGFGLPPEVGEMSDQDIQEWLNNNPEAKLVLPIPTEEPIATEPPVPTNIPPTEAPPPTKAPPPLVYIPPVIVKKPVEDPPPAQIPAPTLVPTVVISSVSPQASVVGEPLTLTINVLPSSSGPMPTGTIKVIANNGAICTASLNSSGNATCVGGIPTAGLYNLVADYSGDGNYLTSQATWFEFMVNKASTTTTITSQSPNPSVVNTDVLFTATVDNIPPATGLPTGSVTFSDGQIYCTVNEAPWSCYISFPNSGSITVTASYSGDGNFNASTSTSVIQDVLPIAYP